MTLGLVASLIITLAAPASAWAQPADAETQTDLEALDARLDDVLNALSSANCEVACRALESMVRAAQRICELDPGPPCARAQHKVEAAKSRVREACPDCTAAAASESPAALPTDPLSPPRDPDADDGGADAEDAVGPAPAAAPDSHGPCAPCTVGSDHEPTAPLAALLLALGLACCRRRRR